MSEPRMTPERLKKIRDWVDFGGYAPGTRRDVRDLLAELDAVTRERDEARKALADAPDVYGYDVGLLNSALDQWRRAFGESYPDLELGQIIMAGVVIQQLRSRLAEARTVTDEMVERAAEVIRYSRYLKPLRPQDIALAALTAAMAKEPENSTRAS